MKDDRIWRPEVAAVLDYDIREQATEQEYGKPEATWWIQATGGVNYYRATLPARHLPGKTVLLGHGDITEDGLGDFHFPRQRGRTAFWMFPGNLTRWVLMTQMKLMGLRVLVEVDDNYTTPPRSIPHVDSGWRKTRDYFDSSTYGGHCKIVSSEATDGVVVSTAKLGEAYHRFNKPIYVCRNSIDPDDWPKPDHSPDGILRVGWAGSASHRYDLADIHRALSWAGQQPDVEIVVLGQIDPGVPHRRIEWTNDLAQFRRNVGQIDVMLCPLRPSEWADCKSDVKALEAAMGGACSIVSKTEPYRPWWDGEAPGYHAETKKDYLKVLKHLIANRDEARETARLAREYVLEKRNIKTTVQAWREAING